MTHTVRVGLDALALPPHFSGAANYIYFMIRSVLQAERDFPVVVFCKSRHLPLFEPYLTPGDRVVHVPLAGRFQQIWFYEYGLHKLLLREDITLFHATHYITPQASESYRIYVTFHDMGFFLLPGQYPWIKRLFFRRRMADFARRADRILAVSKMTARSLNRHFPAFRSKISVSYPGCDHYPKPDLPVPRQPFLLAVNSLEKRKNIPFLIDVYNEYRRKFPGDCKLIIAGQTGNDYDVVKNKIKKSPFREDIELKIGLSERTLIDLYRTASLFVSVSRYEGFGFTPLEAALQDCPVLLYRSDVVAELFGERHFVLDHLDTGMWARKISVVLNHADDEAIRGAKASALKFTWEETGKQLVAIYSEHQSGAKQNIA
jgi:glycosyltransferase involved in cell wall biosynthesis